MPLADVFSTMKAYTGSVYVNDFNMFNRIYKVYIQAEAPYREHKDNINLFFVKAKDGVMVPLTSLGNASYTTGPGSIPPCADDQSHRESPYAARKSACHPHPDGGHAPYRTY